MNCTRHPRLGRCIQLAGAVCALVAAIGSASEPAAVVELHALADVASPVVSLADIAEVRTTDEQLRRTLQALDVAEFSPGVPSLRVTRSQALLRIQLGRDLPRNIHLVGAEWVQINQRPPANADLLVTDRLAELLAQQWQAALEDVEIKLTRPLPRATGGPLGPQDLDITLPANSCPGNGRATVLIYRHQQLVDTWDITFAAQLHRQVIVALTDIPRGTPIQQQQLELQRRRMQRVDTPPDASQFVGRTARRDYKAGEELQVRMMIEPAGKDRLAVKPRDTVRLVAKRGSLTVTVHDAEVVQGGEIGAQVRVRNPRSKQLVTARVVSPSEVRIDF